MNNSSNNFQLIFVAACGFFLVLGLVLFATYKAKTSGGNLAKLEVWGTASKADFSKFSAKLNEAGIQGFSMNYSEKSKDSFENDLINALANGAGPDVVLIKQDFVFKQGSKLFTIPFANYPERTFRDSFIDGSDIYIKPDGILAVPFVADPLVMYFNKDIFTDVGIAQVPKYWSEFPNIAGRITKSDVSANITRSAVAFGEYRNVDNAKELISTLIFQAGNPIVGSVSGNTQSTLGSDDASAKNTDKLSLAGSAVKFYTDFANPQKAVYSWNRALPSAKASFLSEDLAIYFGFASEYADIKIKNPNLNFDVANMPQLDLSKTKSVFGNIYAFGILKTSKNIAQALGMINLFSSADVESIFTSNTYYSPTRRDLLVLPPADAIRSVFNSSALMSKGWLDPDYLSTSQIFQNMIEDISSGRSDVGNAVKNASGQIDNLLK
ncbi:MAG: hypothetical protein WCC74_00505 [Minisyncoccia bacterium]